MSYSMAFLLLSYTLSMQISLCGGDTKRVPPDFQAEAEGRQSSKTEYSACAFVMQSRGWKHVEDVIQLQPATGKQENLKSKRDYQDFELVFEWRVEKGGNSGVIYRAVDGRGLEYQVVDDKSRWADQAQWSAGAIYDLVQPTGKKACKPIGEWNTGRIVAVGNHVEHWLNGEKVVDFDLHGEDWKHRYQASKYSKINRDDFGKVGSPIVLQNHGKPAWFRNIRVRKLDPEAWTRANKTVREVIPLARKVDP